MLDTHYGPVGTRFCLILETRWQYFCSFWGVWFDDLAIPSPPIIVINLSKLMINISLSKVSFLTGFSTGLLKWIGRKNGLYHCSARQHHRRVFRQTASCVRQKLFFRRISHSQLTSRLCSICISSGPYFRYNRPLQHVKVCAGSNRRCSSSSTMCFYSNMQL